MDRIAAFKLIALSTTFLSGALIAAPAVAQVATAAGDAQMAEAEDAQGGDIIVTGTRRATTLQDTPINISAISGDEIAKQRIDDIRDIADFTPGITISDTGPGSTGTIVLRGINAGDSSNTGAQYDDALGVYLGEVPLYYDFKLLDIERVETLLGPQGTLYGLGTLAGAIRYIPKRPDTDSIQAEGHARAYLKDHSDKVGYQADGVINLPIVKDYIAFRSVVGYYYDPGFIDYPLLLQTPGTSLPQAGGTDNSIGSAYATNLKSAKDVNFEKTITTRNQLMFQAGPDFKAILTYAYQQTKTDGNQSNSFGVLGTGKYESAARYLEPTDRHAHLVSAEFNANAFDIADVVWTTAYTSTVQHNVGDVTDLLLDLDYDYEAFPAFSGYNTRDSKRTQINQEVRLVSRHGGPFSWTLGGFYNSNKFDTYYFETTPGLGGFYGVLADDPTEVEYASYTRSKVIEQAVFGEASFKITPAWQVTGGARRYSYSSEITGALVLPLLGDPVSAYDGDAAGGKSGNSGWVWKANTSYSFDRDLLIYATYSKGYRVGGPNSVAPCPVPVPANQQNACALPNEVQYGPDKTKNIELGFRAGLFDNKLNFNFDVFRVDWDGLQVASATFYGVTGITVNGGTARSQGFEGSFTARPTRQLTVQGTYSYTDAKLTEDIPELTAIRIQGPYVAFSSQFEKLDALDGDRLPGSAKNAGSIGATYTQPLNNGAELSGNWTTTYRGSVISRLGYERTFGDKIPGYVLHRAALTYSTDVFDLTLWSNNIFDKYAYNSVGNDRSRIGINDGVAVRYYTRSVINPRTFGIEGRIKFR